MDLQPHRIKGFGWRRDTPDPRDYRYTAPMRAADLPASKSLRGGVSSVFDQGDLGSCTANAIAAALRFVERRQGERTNALSRLYIYYWERFLEGTVAEDGGAMIRTGIKVVSKQGAPREKLWPYAIDRFAEQPPELSDDALHHKAISYWRVPRALTDMKGCIAEGFPFVFGFAVFSSFYDCGADGIAPIPVPSQEELLGWHAVTATGYNDRLYGGAGGFWCLNSWGAGFGHTGFFTLPYSVLLDDTQSGDFWTIRSAAL